MIEVRVLGPVGAAVPGREVDVGGPTAATVLALLATNAPATVSTDRLVEAVWGEHPPATARKSLQAHVSKLRRALEPTRPAGAESVVVSIGDGYRLDTDRVSVDLAQFRRRTALAGRASEWRAALDLWSGEPLSGCLATDLVDAERTRLWEERLNAIEAHASASIREGAPEPVIAELEALVAEQPLRENLWVLLVQALAAAGRRRDALAAYQRAREALAEGAGLDPGPALRRAERAVLSAEAQEPGVREQHDDRRPLPVARSEVIGREEALSELGELLARGRLVTVTGPGGSGKTTIALEAARRRAADLAGGAVFVDLVPAADADGVARAFAAAWGLRYLPDDAELLAVLAARIGEEPTLLMLDNCEHVLDAVAEVVDGLLDRTGRLTVLATSRQALDVSGEQLWPLAPLPTTDAVELFLQRLRARGPRAVVAADRDEVAHLCDALDGLPLAIELAAARAGHLSIAEVLEGIDAAPALLQRHRRRGSRHDSLTATIRWSYDLLDPTEQACLRRLAVWRGTFDRDQAAAVMDELVSSVQATAVVGDLVAKSLVVVDALDGTATYRLLDTIRTFAWAQGERHDETEQVALRHRDWYLAWADRIPAGSSWLRLEGAYALARHHADLLAAMETSRGRGDWEEMARLTVLAGGLLFCPGGHADPERWVARSLEHAASLPEDLLADLYGLGSVTGMMAARSAVSRDRILAGEPLARRNRRGAGPMALALGLAHPETFAEVAEHAEEVLADPDGVQEDIVVVIAGMRPFWTWMRAGLDEALAQAEPVWRTRPWCDDHTMSTWAVHAALLHVAGRPEELAERMDRIERSPAEGPDSPFLVIFEALALAGIGKSDTALERLRRARRLHWVHLPGIENDFLVTVAAIADVCGDEERARRLLEQPDLWSRHPCTAAVHIHHRQRLGLGLPPLFGSTDHTAVSALLDDVLGI